MKIEVEIYEKNIQQIKNYLFTKKRRVFNNEINTYFLSNFGLLLFGFIVPSSHDFYIRLNTPENFNKM